MKKPIALTLKDAAAAVGVGPDHLRNEWRAGRLSLKNKGTQSKPMYLVDYDELLRWWDDVPAAVPGRAS